MPQLRACGKITAMKSKEIRQSFLDFFKERQHTIVPPSSLLPDAPNLLFTNAGMNQFVPIFLGQSDFPHQPPRAADTQKCIRAGGKHNDLEDVGLDTSHHTFFEMLGNWSFGDYFKAEAIDWAWELLVEKWQMPKERLYATYFGGNDNIPADLEAREHWLRHLPPEQVVPGSYTDNFWMMGDTGPCGPCSEIHMDLTPNGDGGAKAVNTSASCLELWNLVFIQFNANPDGSLTPLPARHVDTGLGFERVCGIMQCTNNFRDFNRCISNYESDVFFPLFDVLSELSSLRYTGSLPGDPGADPGQLKIDVAFRVIADHIRCLTFAVADGINPSNEGRGYVLRRILRRAVRYGRNLGFRDPFFYRLVDVVASSMGDCFPEVRRQQERVKARIKSEEEHFNRTLDRGIEIFNEAADKLTENSFPAAEAFRLYDTFGFPLDLTELMARERGLPVDKTGFEDLMEEQRRRAREDHKRKKSVVTFVDRELSQEPTHFVGFERECAEAMVKGVVWEDDHKVFNLIVDQTPFYAEKGGQLGDTGSVTLENGTRLEVLDTQLEGDAVCVHRVKSENDQTPAIGERVHLEIDREWRAAIQRHHTATHLFHWAIQELTEGEANQRGSLVAPDRLRFDFNYPEKLSEDKIKAIEDQINQRIAENSPVFCTELPYSEIKNHPKIHQFFGEKYGELVRVIQLGGERDRFNGFSMELCGGTHVSALGEIGSFKITRESAISAGVRRIEAVCGDLAIKFLQQEKEAEQEEAARALDRGREKEEARRRRQEMQARAVRVAEDLIAKSENNRVLADLGDVNVEELRAVNEALAARLKGGLAILTSVHSDRVSLICYVSDEQIKQGMHAGKIVAELAKICDGAGGGRPDLAQAGGKSPEKLPEVLVRAAEIVGK